MFVCIVDLEAFTTLLLELLTIGLTTNSDNFDSFLGKIRIFFIRDKLCILKLLASFVSNYVVFTDINITRVCVLRCVVLYCTVLYCTVLYCTVLYCTVLYCAVHG